MSSGLPSLSNTAPAVPGEATLVQMIQSPTLATGVPVIRLPSMARPPAGVRTGATPAGGGVAARPGRIPRARRDARRSGIAVLGTAFMDVVGAFISINRLLLQSCCGELLSNLARSPRHGNGPGYAFPLRGRP